MAGQFFGFSTAVDESCVVLNEAWPQYTKSFGREAGGGLEFRYPPCYSVNKEEIHDLRGSISFVANETLVPTLNISYRIEQLPSSETIEMVADEILGTRKKIIDHNEYHFTVEYFVSDASPNAIYLIALDKSHYVLLIFASPPPYGGELSISRKRNVIRAIVTSIKFQKTEWWRTEGR